MRRVLVNMVDVETVNSCEVTLSLLVESKVEIRPGLLPHCERFDGKIERAKKEKSGATFKVHLKVSHMKLFHL